VKFVSLRLVILSAVAGSVLAAAQPVHAAVGPRCPIGATIIPAGAGIQRYLDAGGIGTAFCLEAGLYRPGTTLRPKQDQGLFGIPTETIIDGTGRGALFDGSSGPSGVSIYDLVVQKAITNIRTGDGWVVDGVLSRQAGQYGIALKGQAPVVRNSRALDNGRFGISSASSVNALIENTEIAGNNTRLLDPATAGGTKFSRTLGLVLRGNYVHHNFGRGIWFDVDSYGALVEGNTSSYNLDYAFSTGHRFPVGDGIRVEISCHVQVIGNTVVGNQGPGIAIDGTENSLIRGNRVVAPPRYVGIRIAVQDMRTSEPPHVNCPAELRSASDNTILGNDVTMQGNDNSHNGLEHRRAAGNSSGNSFEANAFHVADCAALRWKWRAGSVQVTVNFPTWQTTYAQDQSGTCDHVL
jgi:parallel beta-helix repeat protein